MAIAVNFWRFAGSPKRIDKVLSATPDLVKNAVTPFEPLDELSGYIIMEYNDIYKEMTMAGIGWKYYHITDRTALPGGRIRLDLSVDVLYTYSSGILATNAYCIRSENVAYQTPYIVDSNAPINAERLTAPKNGYQNGGLVDLAAYGSDMILITVG